MAKLNGQIFLKILTFCNPYDPKNEIMLWNCGILNFQENSVTLPRVYPLKKYGVWLGQFFSYFEYIGEPWAGGEGVGCRMKEAINCPPFAYLMWYANHALKNRTR